MTVQPPTAMENLDVSLWFVIVMSHHVILDDFGQVLDSHVDPGESCGYCSGAVASAEPCFAVDSGGHRSQKPKAGSGFSVAR